MDRRDQRGRSREFGVKLAKALADRAHESRQKEGLDPFEVMYGAAEYLRKQAATNPSRLLDPSRTEPGERQS